MSILQKKHSQIFPARFVTLRARASCNYSVVAISFLLWLFSGNGRCIEVSVLHTPTEMQFQGFQKTFILLKNRFCDLFDTLLRNVFGDGW